MNPSDPYKATVRYLSSWTDAQDQCMELFGTSLATIKTQQDIDYANDIVTRAMVETAVGLESVNLYIGLYTNTVFDAGWQWIDGNTWYDMC